MCDNEPLRRPMRRRSCRHPLDTQWTNTRTNQENSMDLLDKLVERRATAGDAMTAICDLAATEERDLSDTEDENLKALREDADRLDVRCQELRDIQLGNAEAAKLRAEVTATPAEADKATQVRVGDEPMTYSERSGTSFFRDLYASQMHHDPSAQGRIARHSSEMDVEQRAAGTTGNYAGLVVPTYFGAARR